MDLLEVMGGGRARDFANARDHAIIRVLTEGVRRGEVLGMTMAALPEDIIRNPGGLLMVLEVFFGGSAAIITGAVLAALFASLWVGSSRNSTDPGARVSASRSGPVRGRDEQVDLADVPAGSGEREGLPGPVGLGVRGIWPLMCSRADCSQEKAERCPCHRCDCPLSSMDQ
jgi:hypothetical protein